MMLRFWVESEEFVFVVNDIMNPTDMYMQLIIPINRMFSKIYEC
jgi:hypothetical protein